jgi:hypothetical protein
MEFLVELRREGLAVMTSAGRFTRAMHCAMLNLANR